MSELALFDWPPRLSFEQQEMALYEHAQRHVRFTTGTVSNIFDVFPRPIRQKIYRAFGKRYGLYV